MRKIGRDIVMALLMGAVAPGIVLKLGSLVLPDPKEMTHPTETEIVQTVWVPAAEWEHTEAPSMEPEALEEENLSVLFRAEDGTVVEMDMDAYLVGAVLAEMPAWFEPEALKAQAVAARTYALKAQELGGKHTDGSVCGNYACCQAYIAPGDYMAASGTQEAVDKILSCVEATSGQVLTYHGELIEATYFSSSGGSTEDAAAVWGSDYPYLQAVESPGEEDGYSGFRTRFSPGEFAGRLGLTPEDLSGQWIGEVTYTPGGGVDTISLGGQVFRGTQVRSLLGLRSTIFAIELEQDAVAVLTWGYGHRVGMSQYGADAMAVAGSTYPQILEHYYQGTTLSSWTQLKKDPE